MQLPTIKSRISDVVVKGTVDAEVRAIVDWPWLVAQLNANRAMRKNPA